MGKGRKSIKKRNSIKPPEASWLNDGHHNSKEPKGDFLVVEWLRLQASAAGGTGSIPDCGTKIPCQDMGKKQKLIPKKKSMVNTKNFFK